MISFVVLMLDLWDLLLSQLYVGVKRIEIEELEIEE